MYSSVLESDTSHCDWTSTHLPRLERPTQQSKPKPGPQHPGHKRDSHKTKRDGGEGEPQRYPASAPSRSHPRTFAGERKCQEKLIFDIAQHAIDQGRRETFAGRHVILSSGASDSAVRR